MFSGSTASIPDNRESRSSSRLSKLQDTPRSPQSPSRDLTQQRLYSPNDTSKAIHNDVIALSDSDEDIIPPRPPKPIEVNDDLEMSDEEFPELVQKARERARQKELDQARDKNRLKSPNVLEKAGNDEFDDFLTDPSLAFDADPIIDILVTSLIDGTKPLIVKRKLSQRLREVRISWCDRQYVDGQPLGPVLRPSVFLSWRGKRLFDVTTCKSLGIKATSNGILDSNNEGFDADGRIHLEAWTEELYSSYQQGLATKVQHGEEDEEEPEPKAPEEQKIRVIMTPRDMEPYKVMVKPTTTIAKMILAFSRARDIPPDKTVSVFFDGEKLDPESTAEDTDLDDMDTVEVHIK